MGIIIKYIIFFVITGTLICLSWKSLHNTRTHGFYRFFIFELLLVLILMNTDYWFTNPFSLLQIISWLLLLGSLLLAMHGFILIRTIGAPKNGFDDTESMISCGAYKYIRHPLYVSLILAGGGAFLKHPSPGGAILLFFIFISAYLTARTEETENIKKFSDYESYMKKSKMFVPYLF
jgi:protein-S-isoprenylcysteine O-methyltransferase Ste14